MTWFDGALIAIILLFVAAGARFGSLWTAACLTAGFFGACIVDYYALPLAEMMGGFKGADTVAAILLFTGGALCALLPGWLISRLCGAAFLGLIDSAFGLLTGGMASLFAIALTLLILVPLAPKIETWPAWKDSLLVQPLDRYLENTFNSPHFRVRSTFTVGDLSKNAIDRMTPVARSAEREISNTAEKIVNGIKKN